MREPWSRTVLCDLPCYRVHMAQECSLDKAQRSDVAKGIAVTVECRRPAVRSHGWTSTLSNVHSTNAKVPVQGSTGERRERLRRHDQCSALDAHATAIVLFWNSVFRLWLGAQVWRFRGVAGPLAPAWPARGNACGGSCPAPRGRERDPAGRRAAYTVGIGVKSAPENALIMIRLGQIFHVYP